VRDGRRRLRAGLRVADPAGKRRLRAGLRVADPAGKGRVRAGLRVVVAAAKRRLRVALWVAVALGIVAGISPKLIDAAFPGAAARRAPASAQRTGRTSLAVGRSRPPASAALEPGTFIPVLHGRAATVPAAQLTASSAPAVAPLRKLLTADLLVVAPTTLPPTSAGAVGRMRGVVAAEPIDAARIKLDGSYVAMLGVDPSRFRAFAARPTAQSSALWQNVADGDIAVSYLMGQQERLPLGGTVEVAGTRTERLRVGGFGTVGIGGVDAVVATHVAQSLGLPSGNAIVISAPHASLSALMHQIARALPRDAAIVPLVAQAAVRGLPVTPGSAGGVGITAADGPGLTPKQTDAFLAAAESRIGMPYVWGDAGPFDFDCSGLVQWSMRQAGITMPRVAVDQAQTGPLIPLSDLQPGDLLFYHTDPTAPEYISHVAIYLGDDRMEQAPEPGMDVEIVPAVFDGGFAGAVEVYPRVAAAVAAEFSSG
jgi:peptidoglycan DL-endopeptidase CwlO